MGVCVCVRACVRVCVRACVCACVRACVYIRIYDIVLASAGGKLYSACSHRDQNAEVSLCIIITVHGLHIPCSKISLHCMFKCT